MNTPNITSQNPGKGRQSQFVTGAALVLIGLFLFAAQTLHINRLEQFFLPALGSIFLVWGILTRQVGLLIPGGILSGIGLGVYLIEGPYAALNGEAEGGLFLLGFSLGWGLITLFSALFTKEIHWWPLIPGGIMALTGGLLLAGQEGVRMLTLVGQGWPLILIVIGLYLALFRRGLRE